MRLGAAEARRAEAQAPATLPCDCIVICMARSLLTHPFRPLSVHARVPGPGRRGG